MIGRLVTTLALLAATPVFAQNDAVQTRTVQTGTAQAAVFAVGDQQFTPADILDARAIPDLEGPPVIMITFNDSGVQKLMAATSAGNSGQTIMVPIAIDGRKVTDLVTTEVRGDPVLTFTARGSTIQQATALAQRISGRDPLPEELAE